MAMYLRDTTLSVCYQLTRCVVRAQRSNYLAAQVQNNPKSKFYKVSSRTPKGSYDENMGNYVLENRE